jgi:Ca2+-binding EF-hand superfamily protein
MYYLAVVSCLTLNVSLPHVEQIGHDRSMAGEHMSGGHKREQKEEKHFKELDTNGDGDGKLTLDEMKTGHNKMMEKTIDKRFEKADTSHDGSLSHEEAKNIPMISKHFDEIDTNKDSKVTREEMDATMEKMRKKHDRKQSSER